MYICKEEKNKNINYQKREQEFNSLLEKMNLQKEEFK